MEGVREAARGRMAVETGKQRETVLQTEADWEESPAYLGKPLSQCGVCMCVFWGLRNLIKTLLHDRGRRETDSFLLHPPSPRLSEIMELGV